MSGFSWERESGKSPAVDGVQGIREGMMKGTSVIFWDVHIRVWSGLLVMQILEEIWSGDVYLCVFFFFQVFI